MRFPWKKRSAAIAAMLATAGAVTLLVVLPALASTAGDQVPPESTTWHVTPVDIGIGGNGTCSNLFPGLSNVSEYDNPNPQTTTANLPSGNNDGVSFGLTLYGTKQKQRLDVTSTNAAILGIGVKGGTDTTVYDYRPVAPGGVPGDTLLHAPASKYSGVDANGVEQNITQWYAISHLTVCYLPALSLSGTVYNDLDQNGAKSNTEPGQSDWTVTLYKDGAAQSADTTGDTGSYSFSVTYDANATYTVCETPPSGSWEQTTPSTSACSSPDLPNGYTVTSSPTQPLDFGNVETFTCPTSGSDPAGLGPGYYQVGNCKGGDTYTFPLGTVPAGTTVGGVDIGGSPYIGYSATGNATGTVPTVEHLVIPDPYNGTQPKYTQVLYTSGSDLSTLALMPYCNFDPRSDPSTDPFVLASPVPDGVIPGTDTACVISVTTSAPAQQGGTGTLEAWVYALDDATRAFN